VSEKIVEVCIKNRDFRPISRCLGYKISKITMEDEYVGTPTGMQCIGKIVAVCFKHFVKAQVTIIINVHCVYRYHKLLIIDQIRGVLFKNVGSVFKVVLVVCSTNSEGNLRPRRPPREYTRQGKPKIPPADKWQAELTFIHFFQISEIVIPDIWKKN